MIEKNDIVTCFLTTQVQMFVDQISAGSLRLSLGPPTPQNFIAVFPLEMFMQVYHHTNECNPPE